MPSPKMTEIEKLIQTIAALRDPQTGCPWDLKQDHKSLLPFLIEESYEFKKAVEEENDHNMREEIGDVLLQVILHSQLGRERGAFTFDDVAREIREKMIRRHPHVFNNPTGEKLTTQEIKSHWKEIKAREKPSSSQEGAIKEKILLAPALRASYKIGLQTEKLNFDWENSSQVADKVEEEWQELKEELKEKLPPKQSTSNIPNIEEELGDLLFSLAQLARHLHLDPEEVLHKANKKFLRRFSKLEELMAKENKQGNKQGNRGFHERKQEELESLWKKVKEEENKK